MSQPLEYEQVTYNSPDGAQMGRDSQEKIAFYGTTPTTQRANATQALFSVSSASGLLVTHLTLSQQTYQANVTSGLVSSTVVNVSGAPQLSSADLIIVNKQNPDAGHGYVNARANSASALTYSTIILHQINCSTGDLNTSPDAISMVALRGFVNSVTLSPVSVIANNTSEQQFTVTGVAPGMIVPIAKPTDQRGLGIAGTRVVSNNVLGITFVNPGMTAITPTASEVYLYAPLAGIASTVNILSLGIFTSSGMLSCITNESITASFVGVTGVNANDKVLGWGEHHANDQPGLALLGARVTAANIVTMSWYNGISSVGASSSRLTIAAGDTYKVNLLRPRSRAPMTLYSVSLSPSAVGVSAATEQSFTVTGLVNPCVVFVSKPSFTSGIGIVNYRCSSANTLGITFVNPTAASITPPTETYIVASFDPVFGAGHYVEQIVSPMAVAHVALSNEMRNALAGVGLIAGA